MQNLFSIFVKILIMQSILDTKSIQDFKEKSLAIQEQTPVNWGKMNAAQMFQHLNKSLEVIFTDKPIKRMFLGRIIGKVILKKALKGTEPIAKNTPTAPSFVSDDKVDFDKEKQQWLLYLERFSTTKEENMEGRVHPFFGKMTGHQWNVLIYKHIDHHLKQFSLNSK